MNSQEKNTVLIVDDNPTNLSLLVDTLELQNFHVIVAKDGRTAIERAEHSQPDLILLDVMMPGLDGFETCKILKQTPATSNIPVIFMTALREMTDKIKGFNAGGVDYITKPFNPKEVSIRVNAHLTIERQRKLLAELNASKDMFFSIVAHDLKNVFMYVPQLSKILIDSIDTLSKEDIKEIALRLHDDSRQAQSLFENLLEWSRIQIGSISFNPELGNLSPIVEKCNNLYATILQTKNISLISNVEDSVKFYADKNTIFTVLRNIIYNAIKFTREGGKVTVSAKVVDGFVEILVADTGVGMSEEIIDKLFKIDKKITSKGTADEVGTGIGLILCKDLLTKNNGSIYVTSEIDLGSKFYIKLPANMV